MSTTTRLATDKQFTFIRRLLAERNLDAELREHVQFARSLAQRGNLTAHGASVLIDALLDAPKAAPMRPTEDEPEAGVYRDAKGRLLRVYAGQKTGRMLAKEVELEDGELLGYTYLGAAVFLVKDAQRLSLDEVGSLGVATGSCLLCGRRLDDPESVDRGIGPVCAGNY